MRTLAILAVVVGLLGLAGGCDTDSAQDADASRQDLSLRKHQAERTLARFHVAAHAELWLAACQYLNQNGIYSAMVGFYTDGAIRWAEQHPEATARGCHRVLSKTSWRSGTPELQRARLAHGRLYAATDAGPYILNGAGTKIVRFPGDPPPATPGNPA